LLVQHFLHSFSPSNLFTDLGPLAQQQYSTPAQHRR
jgi:hypothetical protein